LYSLIVSGRDGAWDEGHFSLGRDRFLTHTVDALQTRLETLTPDVVEELKRTPTIFAYESRGLPARVGWITELRVRPGTIGIGFAFDPAVPPFTSEDIDDHAWEFDVSERETYRTHWAVKDVDLFDALREAGLAAEIVRNTAAPLPPYEQAPKPTHELRPATDAIELRPTAFRIPAGGVEANQVAIMMPFDRPFDSVHAAIVGACDDAGLVGRRVDNMWEDDTVIQDIFNLIYKSNIVIVDFTGRNSNVFYETGIAHALGKAVVPITQTEGDVPFDLRHHRYLRYLPNGEGLLELREKLTPRLVTLSRA